MNNEYLDNIESCITMVFVRALLDALDVTNFSTVMEKVLEYLSKYKDYLTGNCIENIRKTCSNMITLKRLEELNQQREEQG